MALVFGDDLAGGRLALPVEPSEKLAIVGLSGSGKSFLAARLVEEWLMSGTKIAVFDPIGIWFGLRSGYDGDPAKGFPVRIYGGQRMDQQLREPRIAAQEFIASPDSAVFDLSAVPFDTLHWWTAGFLNRVAELGPTITRPMHFVFEESPMFSPQTGSLSRYQRDCRAAVSQFARVFRNFGVGGTFLTQRAASLDKTCLTQCGSLIALRIAAKSDRRALADWSASNSTTDDMKEAVEKLSSAPVGEGMIWSPNWGKLNGRPFRGLERTTYHPDPRRLADNRAVTLRAAPPSDTGASKWRAGWDKVCGVARILLERYNRTTMEKA